MTIKNSAASITPGFGFASSVYQRTNINTNTGSDVTVTIPSSGGFTTPVSRGYVRVKTGTIGNNSLITVKSITGIDSVNTSNVIQLYAGDGAASAANVYVDRLIPFCTDFTLTNINVVVNVTGNNTVHDFEVVANP